MRSLAPMLRRGLLLVIALPLAAQALAAQAPARRPLRADDLYRMRDVRDPERSPDGKWVAYVVSSVDSARDKNDTDVWMASWDGAQNIRLTSSPESESTPRWSPDGRYLSFLSSRPAAGVNAVGGSQLWLLARAGGEATRLTDVKGGISDYEWSPDAKQLVLVVEDDAADTVASATPKDSAKTKTPKPIVIDRYHFKQDVTGYLGSKRSHLYLFDVESRKATPLTAGLSGDNEPAWSPDGKSIAFVSKRGAGIDRSDNADVYVIEAHAGASPKQLTTYPGEDGGHPAWSPDGRWIAYLRGGDPKYRAYNLNRLAIVPAAGGAPRILTESLDRPASSPQWSADGASLVFLVADDRTQYVARVRVDGGAVEHVSSGPRVISAFSIGGDGELAVLATTTTEPPEVQALEHGTLRPLSHQNDAWLATVQLATTADVTSRSKDGTIVNGLLTTPAGYTPGTKLPMLLRIHGGPNGQDAHAFNFERELFAANGYAVLAVNYRGSAGRGEKYQTSIFADWGDKEVVDLLGAVDHVVASGVADPERLGIGGWSYGAILTNYTIATTPRFKAATSGAGSSLQTSMYGSDQYIVQYETELGPPWKNPKAWEKVSYPFFHADRIKTPTMFLSGEKDFNVPTIGSEQMFQALRSLNVDTQLIIYPGQFHNVTTPSYRKDRLERYLAWYAKYLKGAGVRTANTGAPGAAH